MATIRVAKRQRFTVIDRRAINDERLSFRARGVLAWLLDKPDDWRVNAATMTREGTEGRDAIRSAIGELRALGYIDQRRVRGDDGRWATETFVFEVPARDGFPEPGFPEPGNPTSGNQASGNQALFEDCDRTRSPKTVTERAARGAAREIAQGYWDWVKEQNGGQPPMSPPFMGCVTVVEACLNAGYEAGAVKRAMATMWHENRPFNKGVIESYLDGRRTPGDAKKHAAGKTNDVIRQMLADEDPMSRPVAS